jgi:hypothetical protein
MLEKFIIIFVFLVYILVIFLLEFFLGSKFEKFEYLLILRFVELIIFRGALNTLIQIFKDYKVYSLLYKIVNFFRFLYPVLIKPYVKILMGLGAFFSFYTIVIFFSVKYIPILLNISLSYNTKSYIAITLFVIILRLYGEFLIQKIVANYFKNDNKDGHKKLLLITFNRKRLAFMIYFSYFIILFILSVDEMKFHFMNVDKDISKEILSSFATFIAFDRLIINKSLFKIDSGEHKRLLLEVYRKDTKYKGQDNFIVDWIESKTTSSQK